MECVRKTIAGEVNKITRLVMVDVNKKMRLTYKATVSNNLVWWVMVDGPGMTSIHTAYLATRFNVTMICKK